VAEARIFAVNIRSNEKFAGFYSSIKGMKNALPIIVILVIIVIALSGGVKNTQHSNLVATSTDQTIEQEQTKDLSKKIKDAQKKVDALQKQMQEEENKKTQSQYFGLINIYSVTKNSNPSKEYVTIKTDKSITENVRITGWTIKSKITGTSVEIPQGVRLLFTNSENSKEDIYVSGGETLYLITGNSPKGESFKINKCSGYLAQFQSFIPSLRLSCPVANSENISNIPRYLNNEACFDYIDSYPKCHTETEPLPTTWSYECTNFITTKLNYPSCVDTHKNDKDFYKPEWMVYLKRSQPAWRKEKEEIVLYDNQGKIVSTFSY
jgi:hypothetical protein